MGFHLHLDQTLEGHPVNLRVHLVPVDLFRVHLVRVEVVELDKTDLGCRLREVRELVDWKDLVLPEPPLPQEDLIFLKVLPIGSCSILLCSP